MNECKDKIKCIHNCEKYHHESLHPITNSESVNTVNSSNSCSPTGNSCVFPIMRVKIGNTSQYANILWDCCASQYMFDHGYESK